MMKSSGILALLLIVSMGCAGVFGTVTPKEVQVIDGKTIIAYEVRGVAYAFGSSSIGDALQGGEVSPGFADLIGAIVDPVLRILSGFFGGIGGIGAALAPDNSE